MATQVVIGFRIRARLQPGALPLQKRRQQGSDRFAGQDAPRPLLVRRISAQADARQHVLGCAAGLADVELGDRAKPQLPGALGNGVLHPPAAVAAAPHPQAKAWQVVVKKYLVIDAGRQRQAGHGGRAKLHLTGGLPILTVWVHPGYISGAVSCPLVHPLH